MTEEQTKHAEAFEKFLEKWWPFPFPDEPASIDEIRALKRQVWFCNLSGQPIPDLQEFNENSVRLPYKGSCKLAKKWYDAGYSPFRVYKYGIAYLDIELAIGLYNWSLEAPENIPKLLEALRKNPFDSFSTRDKNRMSMYKLNNRFAMGTIILRDTYPKKILKYLASEFKAGEVVDVEGYRGTGLLINLGESFVKVSSENCYPCWELDWMLKWGYYYYMTETPTGETFSELPFEGGVSLFGNNAQFQDDGNTDPDDFDYKDYLQKSDTIKFNHSGKWILLEKRDGYYHVPFPFTSITEGNSLIAASKVWEGVKFRAQVSDFDYLDFVNGELWITPLNGKKSVKIAWEW